MEKPNLHPKPSEEIQLNIETVTPDTEKDGLANDQNNKKESIKVTPSNSFPDIEGDKLETDEDDARAKIETISP